MRFCASVAILGLGVLAGTPCLALTIQAAPPRPDIAEHLHSQAPPGSGVLPAPSDVKDSFVATGRPQGFSGAADARTTNFNFGPFRATTTVTPGYGAYWNETTAGHSGNPLQLTPPLR
jgi:hypothetical protein